MDMNSDQEEEEDDEDLLSSIHSQVEGRVVEGPNRGGMSSVRQYQFMKNDREEEN